jgi:tetraacyldisaccharide-1-P 4'-kinase
VLRVRNAYHITRTLLPPRIVGTGDTVVVPNDSRVFAFAGIARPERFFSDLTSAGWNVVGTKSFRDHHYFSRSEVERIVTAATKARAAIVLTTDKDAVRVPLDALDTASDRPIAAVPLLSTVEPSDEFRAWLLGQIR